LGTVACDTDSLRRGDQRIVVRNGVVVQQIVIIDKTIKPLS
jgi:hypothetical protein